MMTRAEVSSDALAADDQEHPERPAELGDPQQPGSRPADLVFLGLISHQEQLGDLIHQNHDRDGPGRLGKPPDVARAVLAAFAHPVGEDTDQVVEQVAAFGAGSGQRGQPGRIRGELHAALEVEADHGDRLRREALDDGVGQVGLPRLSRPGVQPVRHDAEVDHPRA